MNKYSEWTTLKWNIYLDTVDGVELESYDDFYKWKLAMEKLRTNNITFDYDIERWDDES
tara:strand:+ start:201 stop:377 length:177 start_codon:yes stop_codon:yes gene_type:complete